MERLLKAADEDEIGVHAPAAKQRVIEESKSALASIDAAASKCVHQYHVSRTMYTDWVSELAFYAANCSTLSNSSFFVPTF